MPKARLVLFQEPPDLQRQVDTGKTSANVYQNRLI